tara:strand:+ start:20243 stop:21004 length:762 start_codon:yes stop_codon:yes gene_type:complete
MTTLNKINTPGVVASYLQSQSSRRSYWKLRWKPVCASTEIELSRWLAGQPCLGNYPRAIIAARQKHGKGQRGRYWQSPLGGVWVSAALPDFREQQSIGLFGLAIALSFSERLERMHIPVKIKWPNDLMVCEKKLAGFLPRLIYRGGTLRLACIGVGMNVFNSVPAGGIALSQILKPVQCSLAFWTAEVLLALERAVELTNENNSLCFQVEKRLWANEVIDSKTGKKWLVDGLDKKGALKLSRQGEQIIWSRWD